MFGSEKFFGAGGGAASFYSQEIGNSLKFEDGNSGYLSRTPTSAGNRRTWTWSGWVKRGNISSSMELFNSAQSSGTQRSVFRFNSSNEFEIGFNPTGSTWYYLYTDAVYRDASSWYHVVLSFDTTQATSSDRTKLYINGELQSFRSASYLSQNTEGPVNNTISHSIGRYQAAGTAHFDGYMTEVIFIDGTALDPTSFGETKEGIWIPKDPTGLTYGTNGFRLPFTETTSANGFNTVTYSGNGGDQSIGGVGFQPDFVWIKNRDTTDSHVLFDSIRGVSKRLFSNLTNSESTDSSSLTSFNSDGFSAGGHDGTNKSGSSHVAWCWGGGTNDKTYTVTVVSDSGNKYRFDGHGTSSITLNLTEGATYTFNYPSAHPLRFSTTSDGTHGGGSEYTTGVTYVSSTQVKITVASGAPVLYYYCSIHSGMGGQINTNTTDGPTHAEGTILSRAKPNADYGFSIVSYAGTGAADTIGHGLTTAPKMVIIKSRSGAVDWTVYTDVIDGSWDYLFLNTTASKANTTVFSADADTFDFSASSSVANASGGNYISYCFADVTGHQKIGSYSGTGSSGNAITGLGFKPAFLMIKNADSSAAWTVWDSTRDPSGAANQMLRWNASNAEETKTDREPTFTSDGFTINGTDTDTNASGDTYIYLAIADTRDALFTSDASGNGNNWTPNALQHSDVMPDTPTNGFATVNPLSDVSDIVLSEGNLKLTSTTDSWPTVRGTIGASSGKWYYEVITTDQTRWGAGWGTTEFINGSSYSTTTGDSLLAYSTDPLGVLDFGTSRSINGSPAFTTSDILQVAIDIDAGKFWLGVNNTWVNNSSGSTGNPAGGSNELETFTASTTMYPSFINNRGNLTVNFGQDSSFNATKIPQGNADDNGKGDFFYAPPSGFLALCNANLPDPAIDPRAGENPEDYFNTVLYSGTGSTIDLNNVGFQPDWVWIKQRNQANEHALFDSVRGGQKQLYSNLTNAEYAWTTGITFDSAGIDISADTHQYNASGRTYASWHWKAGGTAVTNDDGSIQSTVSANTEAGFSIVTYTGNGSDGATVGHGLSQTPEMIIIKKRDNNSGGNTGYWVTQHIGLTTAPEATSSTFTLSSYTNGAVYLNATNAQSSYGFDNQINGNTDTFVAYCFHGVEGYSKFGSYEGNGAADGTFVYTGFRPAWLMVKGIDSSQNWHMVDNTRDTDNVVEKYLIANLSQAEATADIVDFLSNGFKLRNSAGSINTSSQTYIYMAFAEQPFKYSNAR